MRDNRGFLCLLALLLAGCGSGSPGIYPAPAWPPQIDTVTLPPADAASGTQAEFSAAWSKGLGPFQVTWTFDGGTDIDIIDVEVSELSHSATVTLVNPGTAPATFTGSVFVNDKGKIGHRRNFSFTVAPAP